MISRDDFRAARDCIGLTQEELKSMAGVTFQSVANWERGEDYADTSTALAKIHKTDSEGHP